MQILINLLSIALGGIITFFVSRHYYVKATKDLRDEAEGLKSLTVLIIRAMEKSGLAEFSYDQEGKPMGLILKISVADSVITFQGSANVEVKKPDTP